MNLNFLLHYRLPYCLSERLKQSPEIKVFHFFIDTSMKFGSIELPKILAIS